MDFKLVLICLSVVILAQQAEGWVGFNRFGRVGFGGMGFGRFGFGRFPFYGGPFFGGFPMVPPIVVPPIIPPPVVPVPVVGKRSVNMNATECTITSEPMKLTCLGLNTLTCDLVENFDGLQAFEIIVKDICPSKVVETEFDNMVSYHLMAIKEVDHKVSNENYTFVHPTDNKPVMLGLYSSEKITELGFRFNETSCFEQFEKIVLETPKEDFEFQLIIRKV